MRLLAVCLACSIAGPVLAAVGPTRASDVVTLATAFPPTACPASATALLFDTRIRSDGSREPFTIPAGKMLIVTGLDYVSEGVAGGAVAATLLHASSGERVFLTVGTVKAPRASPRATGC